MKKAIFYILWALVAVLAFNLILIAAKYMTFDTGYDFLNGKQQVLNNPIWVTSFYIHLFFGMVSVAAGFVLFFNKLIRFSSSWHKKIGKLYIVAILFFTGPTGFYLAFFAEGGPVASIGFILMSGLWMFITYMALHKILKKDIEGHYKWVIRSYCFTLSGITLRIMTPIGMHWLDWDPDFNFKLTAYLPWMINLVIGELIIYANRNPNKAVATLITRK